MKPMNDVKEVRMIVIDGIIFYVDLIQRMFFEVQTTVMDHKIRFAR